MNINQAIALCGYEPNVKKEFAEFLQTHFSNEKTKIYLFTRNENALKLLLMQIQLPAQFKGQIYDISILIYFPRNFPNSPPEMYFEKVNAVKINPQCIFYVNEENLNIKFDLFFNWENSFKSFLELIEEIKHQFSFCFPIFNLPNGDEREISGDCILPVDSILEVFLNKNVEENNNQNLINFNQNYNPNELNINDNYAPPNINDDYNNNNYNNNNNINNNNNNININNNNNNININNNINMNNNNNNYNNLNNLNNINDYNNYNMNIIPQNQNNNPQNQLNEYYNAYNNLNNPPINQMQNLNINNEININQYRNPYIDNPQIPRIEIDEKTAKINLIKKIIKTISPKIKNQFLSIGAITNKLKLMQNDIKLKINKLNELEEKSFQINETVNNLQKDLYNYNFQKPEKIDFSDLSNLDNILNIQNKNKYIRFAKENSLEELLILIKKAFEKKTIDFQTASLLIRTHSRFIFYLKYKDVLISDNNFTFNY